MKETEFYNEKSFVLANAAAAKKQRGVEFQHSTRHFLADNFLLSRGFLVSRAVCCS